MRITANRRSNGSAPRRRILLAIEEMAMREHLYDLLSRHGCSVKTVLSGEGALAALQDERPNLLLASISTRVRTGWSLTDRIRAFDTELPIILLDESNEHPLDLRTLRDIQAMLPSDVSENELMATINQWMVPSQPANLVEYPGTILVVDDEPKFLDAVAGFLEARGCTVITAESGEEALTQLAQHDPALVFLDIKMPGMDGLVTLKKLKATRPHVPVVMMTALEDEELMIQAFGLGAYEYLTKPMNLRALQAIVLHLSTFVPK